MTDKLPLIRELYEVDRLTLREIAEHFDVSKQAVHHRLKVAGVALRGHSERMKKKERNVLDRKVLEHLYVASRLPAKVVAQQVGCPTSLVYASLRSHGMTRRRGGVRKHPELEVLELGESIVVDRPQRRGKFQHYYYGMAQNLGIRLSVKTLDEESVRLTRVG